MSASWASCAAPEQPLDKAAEWFLAPGTEGVQFQFETKLNLALGRGPRPWDGAVAAGVVEVS